VQNIHTSTYVLSYQVALAGERSHANGQALSADQQSGLAAVEAAEAANYPTDDSIRAEIKQRIEISTHLSCSAARLLSDI